MADLNELDQIRYKLPETLRDAKNVFIPLFGEFSGDIWHVAAAEILGDYTRRTVRGPFDAFTFRTCITLKYVNPEKRSRRNRANDSHRKGIKRGRPSWQYLVNLGLRPTLLYMPDNGGRAAAKTINDGLTWEACNEQYTKQSNPPDREPVWDEIKRDLPPPLEKEERNGALISGPHNQDYLLRLLISTSVVMTQIRYLGRRNAKLILGYRLSGGRNSLPIDLEVEEQAEEKYAAFKAYIRNIYREFKDGSAKPLRGVVLFNFRTGDVNNQHDSNIEIFRQVKRLAKERGLVVVAIPLMNYKSWAEIAKHLDEKPSKDPHEAGRVFDLYEATIKGGYVDGRVKAYFWHLVAVHMQIGSEVRSASDTEDQLIHGIIGGRSGSMDLPAFVGMNAFSWEEPFLTATGGQDATSSGNWSSSHFTSQFPQFLRLLNEFPIMTTGFLDATTLKVEDLSESDTKGKTKVIDKPDTKGKTKNGDG
ncbi:hypothetical protein GGR58DRAFT_504966 [Xylaria digitata]|nr:hypothetical protein GGR58DRAFT_504966 [Xylaria digitata]